MSYRIAHDRNTGIDAALQQHFADFHLGAAVVARGAVVGLQLVLALLRCEERDVDEAAGF